MNTTVGKWLILAGLVMVVLGVIVYFFYDKLSWMGRLPGDIRMERENFRFYFPITTLLLLSIVLSILIRIVLRFLR